MNERERLVIIVVGSLLAFAVTGAVIFLAVTAESEGERNLLIGGLLGAQPFGGAALFALLGINRQGASTSTTTTIPQDPPNPPIVVKTDPTPEKQEP